MILSDAVAIQLITSIATIVTVVVTYVLQRIDRRRTNDKIDIVQTKVEEGHSKTVDTLQSMKAEMKRPNHPRSFDDLPGHKGFPNREL